MLDLKTVFVLFAIIAAATVTVFARSANPCVGAPHGSFIDDPSSCPGYFQCINGVPINGTCPSDLYFNPIKGLCDYKQNVNCTPTSDICIGVQHGGFVDNPSSCEGYFQCLNGVAVPGQCPNDFWFNPAEKVCENLRCTPLIPSGPVTSPPQVEPTTEPPTTTTEASTTEQETTTEEEVTSTTQGDKH